MQSVCVDGKVGTLSLWDTAGQEDYDRLRPLSYPGTDVFVVCYSVTSPSTLTNIKNKWIEEIRFHAGSAPIVLVGTKVDARSDPEVTRMLSQRMMHPVTTAEGADFANRIGAKAFVECSAFSQDGIKEVFDSVTRVGRDHRVTEIRQRKTRSVCSMM
jgi:Ras-related C3 botulinum toxin substrate 1